MTKRHAFPLLFVCQINTAFVREPGQAVNDLPGRPCLANRPRLYVADSRLATLNERSDLLLSHAAFLDFDYEVLNVHKH